MKDPSIAINKVLHLLLYQWLGFMLVPFGLAMGAAREGYDVVMLLLGCYLSSALALYLFKQQVNNRVDSLIQELTHKSDLQLMELNSKHKLEIQSLETNINRQLSAIDGFDVSISLNNELEKELTK